MQIMEEANLSFKTQEMFLLVLSSNLTSGICFQVGESLNESYKKGLRQCAQLQDLCEGFYEDPTSQASHKILLCGHRTKIRCGIFKYSKFRNINFHILKLCRLCKKIRCIIFKCSKVRNITFISSNKCNIYSEEYCIMSKI